MTETEGPRRSGRSKKKPDYQDKEQQEKEEPKEDAKPKAKGKGKKNQDKKQENYKEDPESPQKHSSKTVLSCLTTLNLSPSSLSAAFNLVEEFKIIKKQYFKLILIAHPDKGGDAKSFRAINTAFESLRDLFEKNSVKTFKTDGNVAGNAPLGTSTRSWDYYFNAAESEVPIYKVELARSNRSKCVASGKANNHGENAVIPKNEIRIGSINRETGSYGRWIHLKCWRVPSKIWAGCPNPDDCDDPKMFADALSGMNEVLLSGFAQLSEEEKDAIVLHVMDRSNWAKMTNRKDAYVAVEHEDVPAAPVASIAFDPIYRDPVVENPINLKRDFVDENIVAIPRKKAKAEVHSDALVVGAAPGTLVKSSTLFSNKTVVLTGYAFLT